MTPLLGALALLAAAASGPVALAVDAPHSTIRFQVEHKLHRVEGISRSIEGRALLEDGKVRAMVRVPVQSFGSGDANRDAHMLEVLEAGRFPYVVLKAAGGATLPAAGAGPVETTLQGELDFHGVRRAVVVPVKLEAGPGGAVRVRGRLTVSLESHAIQRPSLLLVKLEDACLVEVDLTLGRAG